MDPSTSTPFVAQALQELRRKVLPDAAVLGFVGSPYTLATYLIEGKTSRDYLATKQMMWKEPTLMHALLQILADNIANYAIFQIEHGAQLIQLFDSWAGHLSAKDYDIFAAPYQAMVMDKVNTSQNPSVLPLLESNESLTLFDDYDIMIMWMTMMMMMIIYIDSPSPSGSTHCLVH
jgi:uroporphyrinogen decarboxylase